MWSLQNCGAILAPQNSRCAASPPPLVFTEQGVAMLSSVLHSERAIQINIEIMKTFVRMRKMLIGNK